MKRRGFTLVEILVVVALLGALAALLFPVLARGREAGRQTTCLSNLRQQGVAIALYAEDYDGFFPWAMDPESRLVRAEIRSPVIMPDIRLVLEPYLRAGPVYQCPSDPGNQLFRPSFYASIGSSYSYNWYLAFFRESEATLDDATDTYLCSDGPFWHVGSTWRDGRTNELFADLHAKSVPWLSYVETVAVWVDDAGNPRHATSSSSAAPRGQADLGGFRVEPVQGAGAAGRSHRWRRIEEGDYEVHPAG